MKSTEIRRRFLAFFKQRGHAILPSASLVPENDPSALFISAGVQPLVSYLLGEKHPAGKRLANVQKCVRTTDIEDVGDNTHATFFEMLGNWSLGDYFKQEAIEWSYAFLTSTEEGLGLDPARLYVTVFAGDQNSPRDTLSAEIWQKVGVPKERIYFKGADANWWPAVKGVDSWSGPTGPCTEMFYDITPKGLGDLTPEEEQKAEDEQKIVEVWNDVFMEFQKDQGKVIGKLKERNVDTGAGLERLLMVIQKKGSIYETDLFDEIISKIKNLAKNSDSKSARIIADHIRTSVFMIADGVLPTNTDRGYILRRLMRRAVRYADSSRLGNGALTEIAEVIVKKYQEVYPELKTEWVKIKKEISLEEEKFRVTLREGIKWFGRMYNFNVKMRNKVISGTDAFYLFQTYGFPLEMTIELADEKGLGVDVSEFNQEMKKHQQLSRAGAGQKFKGGLAGTSELETRYHTATHLLHQALRNVLGDQVQQKGSNITPERLRFDFVHGDKLTTEEKLAVETEVNNIIQQDLPVNCQIMNRADAEKTDALRFFGNKYGEQVSVYYIGDSLDSAYSKEFCGGPHVSRTGELGEFKIIKEEAIAAGIRRIKAVLK